MLINVLICFNSQKQLGEQYEECQNRAKEMKTRIVELESKEREISRQIRIIKREIIPLTQGVKEKTIKERPYMLRNKVRVEHSSSLCIQKLFRAYKVRSTLKHAK